MRVRRGSHDVTATWPQRPPEGSGLLCLRPAHVRVDDPCAENRVTGVVQGVSWRGPILHVEVAVDAQSVKLDIQAHAPCPSVGEKVALGFSSDAAVLLDHE